MRLLFAILAVFISLPALAGVKDGYCFQEAADRAGVNKDLLIAIAKGESGFYAKAINKANSNGTEDIGVMQINSSHFQWLKSVGITRKDLFNPCVNIHVGALILSECIRIHGNTWAAVGAYNAGHKKTAKAERSRRVYANKVMRAYKNLKGA